MKHFFCKLIPPRPSFTQDMNPVERAIMMAHSAYWKDLSRKRLAIVFGLVQDPKGGFGVGVIEAEDDAHVKMLTDNDPVIKSKNGFRYEIFPMTRAIAQR